MASLISQLEDALSTMYANVPRETKVAATHYLEQFQKSSDAWDACLGLLASPPNPAKLQLCLFAAQTLRSKITYDWHQLGPDTCLSLKDSVLDLLVNYLASSHRLVRTQLAIALAHLALQCFQWPSPLPDIISRFLDPAHAPCLLHVLAIMPEELCDAQKTSLSDHEFNQRTQVLISDQVEKVLGYLQALAPHLDPSLRPLLLDCLNSWIKECPIEAVLQVQALTNLIFESLANDDTFEKAVDCLCTVLRETADIDNPVIINALYQQLLQLNEYMMQHPEKRDDPETTDGLMRLHVEAAELWHVRIAKDPAHFKPLVDILVNACATVDDLDVVKYTFYFWNMLKLLLTLPRYSLQRAELAPCFEKLVQVVTRLLQYPTNAPEHDLFHGDREAEDKFKEFRYELGDVLKDCCAVVGASKALAIPFARIQDVIGGNGHAWQQLEAPLFALRSMGQVVPHLENTILPTIFEVIVQLPEHPKVRYAATLMLGRYTEWTNHNSQFLEPQLQYILKSFDAATATTTTTTTATSSNAETATADSSSATNTETIMATSRALMYFCQDCLLHLVHYLDQLYSLYGLISEKLTDASLFELADGLAHVVSKTLPEYSYQTIKMFLAPTVSLLQDALSGKGMGEDTIERHVEVLRIFMAVLKPKDFEAAAFPAASYFVAEIWPLITQLLNTYTMSFPVSERVLKLVKSSIQSFSTYLVDILGQLAQLLVLGYQQLHFGCYLWVSGVLIREYGDEYTSDAIKQLVYDFGKVQCELFLSRGESYVADSPEVVEDFMRMTGDLLMYFSHKLTADGVLVDQIFKICILALESVNETYALIQCLHFLIDFVSWGLPHPPISFFDELPEAVRAHVQQWLVLENRGGELLRVVVAGLVFRFPADVQQDGNELLLKVLLAVPSPELLVQWMDQVLKQLPNADATQVGKVAEALLVSLPQKDLRSTRVCIKDFITWYQRKNVSPRTEF